MKVRRKTRRALVSYLLVTLPLVTAGRLLLDGRALSESTPGVETRHDSDCVRLHDHELCVLLFRTPWSRTAEPDGQLAIASVVSVERPIDERLRRDPQILFPSARSPPLAL